MRALSSNQRSSEAGRRKNFERGIRVGCYNAARMKLAARHASDRLLDLSVAALAWWTLCCNATVLTGGTGRQLLITAGISGAVLLGLAAAWWRRRRANPPVDAGPRAAPCEPSSEAAEPSTLTARLKLELRKPRWWALLASVAVIVWWPDKISNWAMWWVPAALIVLFTVSSALEPWPAKAQPSGAAPAWQRGALWAISIAAALITACLHLPNTDDVLYVNIAVALADDPGRTLFAIDTLHGATVIPHTAYHVCSFELLAGALSLITRIPPLEIMHLGLSVFAALLTPIAWSRLFRLLDPQRALWMVVVVMLWYVLDGTTPFSLSMHAFARLFQGKAVLASAGVAAITAYGIEFGLRPSCARLLWLAAAQIAGLGLSSTGVWLCPLVAVTAVITAQPIHWRAWKPVALACLSSGYVLAIGIWLALHVHGVLDSPPDAPGPAAQDVAAIAAAATPPPAATSAPEPFDVKAGFERIRKAFALTFFTLDRGFVYAAFLLLAWPLARTTLARRYIVSFMVVGWFLLCSPWLARVIADRVTGYSTYPRVTWFLPFGGALAICFVAPIVAEGRRGLRLLSLALSAALIATFFSVAPKRTVFEAARLSWPPQVKVEHPAYEVSLRLKKELPAGSAVLAPQSVSLLLPMLLDAPLPIMTKPRYFTSSDRKQRLALRERTERAGVPLNKEGRSKLLASLDQFKIRGVVLSKDAALTNGMSAALTKAGFHRIEPPAQLDIWIREPNLLERP